MFDLDPLLLLPFLLVITLMLLPIISRKMHGPISYIQPNEVAEILSKGTGPAVYDLRSAKDFARGHIPGTINIAPSALADQMRSGGGDAILVCQSDSRSIKLAGRLGKAGLNGVRVLQGGLFRWKRSRLPIVQDG